MNHILFVNKIIDNVLFHSFHYLYKKIFSLYEDLLNWHSGGPGGMCDSPPSPGSLNSNSEEQFTICPYGIVSIQIPPNSKIAS